MFEVLLQSIELLVHVLEIVGAGALVLGFVIATTQWFRQSLRAEISSAVANYRQALGRVTLIGLEVLVAATIIKTVTLEPTIKNLGRLAIMVVIRTILGWTTVLEMSGRWPWQRPQKAERSPTKS